MQPIELPNEIWFLIAKEVQWMSIPHMTRQEHLAKKLPLDSLIDKFSIPPQMIGVHRTFFVLYMSHKYREVHWAKFDWDMKRQLEGLQSPVAASYVQHLHVHAWFIDKLIQRDQKDCRPPGPSIFELLAVKVAVYLTMIPPKRYEYATISSPSDSSATVLSMMISAIQNMRNIEEYHFEMRDLALNPQAQQFLYAARQAFSSTLRSLSLHTSIFRFRSIFSATDFGSLAEISLFLDYYSVGSYDPRRVEEAQEVERRELEEVVAPFLNRYKDTLTSLSLSSASSADLSPLFRALCTFPSLRRFSSNIYMDEPHLSDVEVLVNFLHRHRSSLLFLDLKTCTPDEGIGNAAQRREQSWLRVQNGLMLKPDIFDSLEAVHIPCWQVDFATVLLKSYTSKSLTHLSLKERSWNIHELARILDLFADRPLQLQSLLIHVRYLGPAELRLLSRRLLGLQCLVIFFDMYAGFQDELQPLLSLKHFIERFDTMPKDELTGWTSLKHFIAYSVGRHDANVPEGDSKLLSIAYTKNDGYNNFFTRRVKQVLPQGVESREAVRWHMQLHQRRYGEV